MTDPTPLDEFAAALKATRTLSLQGTQVLIGKNGLADGGGPNRIVLVPTVGEYVPPRDKKTNINDVMVMFVAQCWGDPDDGNDGLSSAWWMQRDMMRALDEQTVTNQWEWLSLAFDTQPDTTGNGQALEVKFRVRLPVSREAGGRGRVDEVTGTPVSGSPGSPYTVP